MFIQIYYQKMSFVQIASFWYENFVVISITQSVWLKLHRYDLQLIRSSLYIYQLLPQIEPMESEPVWFVCM